MLAARLAGYPRRWECLYHRSSWRRVTRSGRQEENSRWQLTSEETSGPRRVGEDERMPNRERESGEGRRCPRAQVEDCPLKTSFLAYMHTNTEGARRLFMFILTLFRVTQAHCPSRGQTHDSLSFVVDWHSVFADSVLRRSWLFGRRTHAGFGHAIALAEHARLVSVRRLSMALTAFPLQPKEHQAQPAARSHLDGPRQERGCTGSGSSS